LTDLNIKLLPWQQKVWNKVVRFKVVAAGRRTGKTLLAVYLLLYYALQAKAGHVFYVAPTQGQARDIMWQVLLEKGNAVIKNSHINNLQVTLINGATISLKGADRPETMRGVSLKYLVMDEYADMKPEVWEQILRPALADQKGGALFIGTPMGRNHFYDLYKYAEDEEDDTWNAWHFTSYDNPLLDAKEIDAAKKSMSSFAFRQEFMASFEAQGSDLFKEEWIQMGTEEPKDGSYYLAIDMAGFEDATAKKKKKSRLDSTSIACVKVSESGWWVDDIIHGRWTFEETAEKIFEAVEKYQPLGVGIEKGISKQAIMSPLTDMMRQRNTFFTIQELTHGNKRKVDRVVAALQGRFEHGTITLNKGEWNIQFLDELFQFPNPQVHDDLIDSLAYIDQLAQVTYYYDFEEDNFEALDTIAGY
jgi:predicted phage terminase large subunit-like protein|tara:strand:+ start:1342 stop:2595 length:1254 start_codon:yes stop_codon:yes gene_type:complete